MKTKMIEKIFRCLFIFSLMLGMLYTTTPARALSTPNPLSPADGATTTVANGNAPLGIPTFQWQPVPSATTYRMEVSSDIGFTTTLLSIVTTNTIFTPISTANFGDGIWYWHVRVESPGPVSDYSAPRSFTKQWASPANLPVLISPTNGATLDFYDSPTFSWNPVVGAARYKLQIYSSPGGWATPLYSFFTLTTSYQPIAKFPNGTSYYWRVLPYDQNDHQGTPSAERSFNASYNYVPTLLEPEDNANPTFTPTFRWTAVRGAQYYHLQYTTVSGFNTDVTQIYTNNTSYTPTDALANDVNHYWRVRSFSGSSVSAFSPQRTFVKRWYIKPVALTPTNNYIYQRMPFFSWTPVPGASYYLFEYSYNPGFSPLIDSGTTSNTFYETKTFNGGASTQYWRVTPYDGNGKAGVSSDTVSYDSVYSAMTVNQVYPLFYYTPDNYPAFPGVTTNPHEDRTVPIPIFIWNRIYNPPNLANPSDVNAGQIYPDAYRIQVDDNPLFTSINWAMDTQNTVATPTASNPFTPLDGSIYYWRVRPLIGGSLVAQWSQVWKTRFDSSKKIPATNGAAPQLIRPTDGFEFSEATPLLEWFPLSGASAYDVEISQDETFNSVVDSATVSNPAYAPSQVLAQRSLLATDFGIYYWRVRQSPNGTWSSPNRFQIAAQSQWLLTRSLGAANNRLQIGSDPAGDTASPDYDLTDLQAAQSSSKWYFGFNVPSAPTQDVTYALYLDIDHQNNSGATFDAYDPAYNMTTISTYRPEYAIYILQQGGVFSSDSVYIYRWNVNQWDTVNVLDNIGGNISYNNGYVEINLPNTSIGYQDTTGSYTISLLSLPPGGGAAPLDSVPSDPNVPGTGAISRFSSVTERLNLIMQPNNAGADPTNYPSVLPFFWDWPIRAPWSGAIIKAYLDAQNTTEAGNSRLDSNTAYFGRSTHTWETDLQGDNSYYWRIQPYYEGVIFGAWSQSWRFERKGFVPQNLQTSVTFSTPTFSWDMAEGAQTYDLQVDDDPSFSSPAIDVNTKQTSFTHTTTLSSGFYYWRVRIRRLNVTNKWTTPQALNLQLPTPSGMTPASGTIVEHAPTLCWTPLIKNSTAGDPVLAAWMYRIQISKDSTFSTIFDGTDTEQSCWTPSKGYEDGTYYWRIAMIDGANRPGPYSANQTFTKQYQTSTLTSPVSGSTIHDQITFVWTAVNDAAGYRLEVSQAPTFSPLYDSVWTENTQFTPIFNYGVGTYYWRVAIVDKDGKLGPFNTATIILESPTPTPTITMTPVISSTPTLTRTKTITPTITMTRTISPTPTTTMTQTATFTSTLSITSTVTLTPTISMTPTITLTPTITMTPTITFTPSITPTPSMTLAISLTPTNTSTATKTETFTPTNTPIKTETFTPTFTPTRTDTPTNSSTPTPTSSKTRTPTRTSTPTQPSRTFVSFSGHDGWVLESSEFGSQGNTKDSTSTTMFVGDNNVKKQYRSILSFSTGALPDTAIITAATLKVKQQGMVGGPSNIVSLFQGFMTDVKKGFFGTSSSLEIVDFQSAAGITCGPATPTIINGIYNINLTCAKNIINKLTTNNGLTQIRLRFKLDDNNNTVSNYLSLYSGNATLAANRPQLVIRYTMP